MRHLSPFLLLFAICPTDCSAGIITIASQTETPTKMAITWDWDGNSIAASTSPTDALTMWEADLAISIGAGMGVAQFEHQFAPHSPEGFGGILTFSGFAIPSPGSTLSLSGSIGHPGVGHDDFYKLSFVRNLDGTGVISAKGVHNPEPGTLALMSVGLIGFAGVRRHRKRQQAVARQPLA